MKLSIFNLSLFLTFLHFFSSINYLFCQDKNNFANSTWVFKIPNEYESYTIFKVNKSLKISFWEKSKENAYIYGNPFTYYGFWDTFLKEPQPKKISDLKPIGKYLFFYDDLIKNNSEKNKIGYDSLGNLYSPTRMCQWTINDELPEGLPPTTLTLNFNMNPDVYKKVDKIPDYVLISLRKNKEDWQRYLDFMEHKESKVTQLKAFIYTIPNKQSKMYLLKNDEVEILEEKLVKGTSWLKIRYYGSKTIEGWIKKTDVE
ncbi:SH3 domain-containing protein [Pseudarcicella hirudinis]